LVVTERISGHWTVARPLHDSSWWHRVWQERACRKSTGHCWHPEAMIDWWCCMCSAEIDGLPPQRCRYCLTSPPGPCKARDE
jgi:hypothetical protein